MGRCSLSEFPRLRNYTAVLRHFNSVKPWDSKYNPDYERPIGKRVVKACDGKRFNYAMRKLRDGSIAFRLYNTDCVIYHPDGTLTIEGYPSVTTSAFIGSLTPHGISHTFRGRRDPWEPVLHLAGPERLFESSWGSYKRPDWNAGQIIQAPHHAPVRLRQRQRTDIGVWEPVEPDRLAAFRVPTIDRKLAREVSRKYNLPTLAKVMNAAVVLADIPPPVAGGRYGHMNTIMDALLDQQYLMAIRLMPRGGGSTNFGRRTAGPGEITPGFLQKLRTHIYDHEGVIDVVEKRSLSPSAYRKYIADTKRLGIY